MDEQQGASSRVRVYSSPEDGKPAQQAEVQNPVGTQPGGKPHGRRMWLYIFPLVAWIACLGLATYAVMPLFMEPQAVEIPVTGGHPTRPPTKSNGEQPHGMDFISEATLRLEMCSASFRDYFILEQLAIDNPGIFENEAWRTDVTDAMHMFQANCEMLGSLPAAPPAYAEVEHWLKMAANEVEPATTSFTAALEKEQAGQFRISIQHMLRFVDYIHNAESAMDGMLERKEI